MLRYRRQILIFGEESQKKLLKSKVAVIGAGGLGSSVLYYLASAGIGEIKIVDYKEVDMPDLNRQILYTEKDVGRKKAEASKERLEMLNSEIKIQSIDKKIDEKNIDDIIKDCDVVVDCLDNFSARYILNDACLRLKKPLVHAAVEEMRGQATTVIPGRTPCLRCIFPNFRDRRMELPILGSTPGMFGAIQANEVVKLITGYGETLVNKLLIIDLKTLTFDLLKIKKRKNCICQGVGT